MDLYDEINKAISAHKKWKIHLSLAINKGESSKNPTDTAKDNLCMFGKWLYGSSITEEEKSSSYYQSVKDQHTSFHKIAADILTAALAGDKPKAKEIMKGDYKHVSEKLITTLLTWQETSLH